MSFCRAPCVQPTSALPHMHAPPPAVAGNFADGRKTFDVINYDDPAQFEAERAAIR